MFLRKQTQPGGQMSPLQDIGWMLDRFMPNFAAFPRMPGMDVFVNYPTINVNGTDGVVLVQAEVPGLGPDDIELSAEGNTLTIKGEKKEETEGKQGNCYLTERRFGSFLRRIDLPCGVDAKRAQVRLEKGVLTLRLPKLAADVSRTIKIQAS